jgi:predicted N-formylglutamate amidohydrolase
MDAMWTVAVRRWPLVITYEHGGNRIPVLYRDLLHGQQRVLESHRGYDQGALVMARALAAAFAALLVASAVSGLLVDLNRSVGHPRLHSEATRKAPAEVRQGILKHHCQPYRAQAERLVRQAIADDGLVIHLSSHSFTPELAARYETPISDCSMTRLDRGRGGSAHALEGISQNLCARSHRPPQLPVCW